MSGTSIDSRSLELGGIQFPSKMTEHWHFPFKNWVQHAPMQGSEEAQEDQLGYIEHEHKIGS